MEGFIVAGESSSKTLTYVGVAIAIVALILSVFAATRPVAVTSAPEPTERRFVLSADLLNGSSRWFPAALIAYEGDTIIFNITNRAPVQHGFTVEGLGIQDVVDPGQSKEFRIESVSAGLYRYFCQLHAGHLGGQLWVQDR